MSNPIFDPFGSVSLRRPSRPVDPSDPLTPGARSLIGGMIRADAAAARRDPLDDEIRKINERRTNVRYQHEAVKNQLNDFLSKDGADLFESDPLSGKPLKNPDGTFVPRLGAEIESLRARAEGKTGLISAALSPSKQHGDPTDDALEARKRLAEIEPLFRMKKEKLDRIRNEEDRLAQWGRQFEAQLGELGRAREARFAGPGYQPNPLPPGIAPSSAVPSTGPLAPQHLEAAPGIAAQRVTPARMVQLHAQLKKAEAAGDPATAESLRVQLQTGMSQLDPQRQERVMNQTKDPTFWGEFGKNAKDLAMSFGAGANSLISMAGDLYGLASGDMDNAVSQYGQEAVEFYNSRKSPEIRAAEEARRKQVDVEQDELGKAWAYVRETVANPSLMAGLVAENIPNTVAAGGAGSLIRVGAEKVLLRNAATQAAKQLAAKQAAGAGLAAAIGAGAVMQGTDVGGDQYAELVAELDAMPAAQAAQIPEIANLMDRGATLDAAKLAVALTQARTTGVLAGALSVAAQNLPGAKTIERALVGGAAKKGAGRLASAAVGAAGEAASEVVEEGGGRMITNIEARPVDPSRPVMKDVGETAAQAGLVAGALGAGAGSVSAAPSAGRSSGRAIVGTEPGLAEPAPSANDEELAEPSAPKLTTFEVENAAGQTKRLVAASLREAVGQLPDDFGAIAEMRELSTDGAASTNETPHAAAREPATINALKGQGGSEGTDRIDPSEGAGTVAEVVGEKIDREWNAFSEESKSLGIPRAEMPQVKAEHRGALTQFLKARDILSEDTEVLPTELKPTQAEYSPAKVAKAREFTGGDRAILVSQDNHVVDGHHQWMAKLTDAPDERMRVIRLDAPISDILAQMKEFPSAEQAAGRSQPPPKGESQTQAGKQPPVEDTLHDAGPEFPLSPAPKGNPYAYVDKQGRAVENVGGRFVLRDTPVSMPDASEAADPASDVGGAPAGSSSTPSPRLKAPTIARGQNKPAKFIQAVAKAGGLKSKDKAARFLQDFAPRLHKANAKAFESMEVHVLTQAEWNAHERTGAKTPDSSAAYNPTENTLYLNADKMKGNDGSDAVSAVVHEAGHFAEQFALGEALTQREWAGLSHEKRLEAKREYSPLGARISEGEDLTNDKQARSEWVAMQFSRVVRGDTDQMPKRIVERLQAFLDQVRELVRKWVGSKSLTTAELDSWILDKLGYAKRGETRAAKADSTGAQEAPATASNEPRQTPGPEAQAILRGDEMTPDEIAEENRRNAPLDPDAVGGANNPLSPTQEPEAPRKTAPSRVATSAPEPGAITDFGEKITGAKKDLWGKLGQALRADLPGDVKAITLAKHFPEPNYEVAIKAGASAENLATVAALRDLIPRKPTSPYKLQRWGELVLNLHGLMRRVVDGNFAMNAEAVDALLKKGEPFGGAITRKVNLFRKLGYPLFTKAGDWTISSGTFGVFNGVRYENGRGVTYAEKDGRTYYDISSESPDQAAAFDEVVTKLRLQLETEPETKKAAETKFELFRDRKTNEVFIGKRGVNGVVRIKAGFKKAEDARAYLRDNREEVEKTWDAMKIPPQLRRAANNPREGVARRTGDVTPVVFQDTFGFRGVQFGNYVEDARRQADLNEAFDAFMDMADAIGVPPKALSLDGSLGLAFGARGAGAHVAHYEPDLVVINITKTRGPGSMAHEWFHGLDNYFARLEMTGDTAAKAVDEFATHAFSPAQIARPKHVRAEVWEAFKRIRDVLAEGPFAERSDELDATRSKAYYGTTIEKAARAFETYVEDRLSAKDISNDYLVNINKAETRPYPSKEEMNAGIRAVFDNLFNTLEVRTDSRSGAMLGTPATALGPKATTWQYTIQQPMRLADGRTTPGYVQIDEIKNGVNVRSSNLATLRAEGIDLPEPPVSLPTGQYTLEEVRAATESSQVVGTPASAPTDTPEFQRWFDGSKVVDTHGMPRVMYHGAGRTMFETFQPNAYFASDPGTAEKYMETHGQKPGRGIYPVYLAVKNPLVVNSTPELIAAVPAARERIDPRGPLFENLELPLVRKAIRNAGFDGVKFVDSSPDPTLSEHEAWLVFEPTQIKSATGNRGAFDHNDPSILGTPPEEISRPEKPQPVPRQPGMFFRSLPDTEREAGARVVRQVYERRSQEPDLDAAAEIIREFGDERAMQISMSKTNDGVPPPVKSAIYVKLIQAADQRFVDAKTTEERAKALRARQALSTAKAPTATEQGQQIAMYAQINRSVRSAALNEYLESVETKQNERLGESGKKAVSEAEDAIEKVDKEAIDQVAKRLDRALRNVAVPTPLWEQYRADAAQRMADWVDSRATLPQDRAPLADFTQRVINEMQRRLDPLMPERPSTQKPAAIDVLKEAVANRGRYAEILSSVRVEFSEKYGEGSPMLDAIDTELANMGLQPYSKRLLTQAIDEAHAAMRTNVRELAKLHLTKTDAKSGDLADALVSITGLSGADATKLANDLSTRAKELVTVARTKALDALKKRFDSTPKAKNILSAIERTVRFNNLGAFTRADMLDGIAKRIGLPTAKPEEMQEIVRLADAVETASNGATKARAQLDLANRLRVAKGFSKTDVATAVWYANMLSGYTTQLANVGGNVMNGTLNLATVMATNPRHAGEALRGWIEGFGEGWQQAKAIVKTGRGSREFDAKTGTASPVLELVDYTRDFPSLNDAIARGLNRHAAVMRYVFRLMKGVDAAFYYPAREAFVRVATAKLLEGGYHGKELYAKVREVLAISPEAFSRAKAKAEREGFTGLDLALRTANIVDEMRHGSSVAKQAAEASEKFALETTFNSEPVGWAGVLYRHLADATESIRPGGVPVLKVFLPFVRIPTNLFNASMNWTPMGAVRAHRGMPTLPADGKRVERVEFTEDERSRLMVQSVGGSLAMGGLAALALGLADDDEEPWFTITATGPDDYRARQQLQATGWSQHSIKLGDGWVSYKDSPLLTPLALVGHVVDAVRYQKSKDDLTLGNMVVDAVLKAPRVVFDTSMLSGLGQLFDLLQSRSSAVQVGQFLTRVPITVAVPNLLAQIDRTFNPEARQADGPLGQAGAALPFVRNTGSAKTDPLGETVERAPLERFLSLESNDPLREVLRDKNVFISVPRRDSKVGTKPMAPAQYDEFVRVSGEGIRRRLRGAVPMLRRMAPNRVERLVDRITDQERQRAKAIVFRHFASN